MAKKSAITELDKVLGDSQKGVLPVTEMAWYATGVSTFDVSVANGYECSGGFPGGRIVELYGNESSGKTTLALHAAANAQKNGKIIVYLDFEKTLNKSYLNDLGVDTTSIEDGGLFALYQPDSIEDGFSIMSRFLSDSTLADRVGIFIVDSVAAMEPSESQGPDATDRIGAVARSLNKGLRSFNALIGDTDACAIFINQLRMNIGQAGYGNPETTPGGKALKFYASLRVGLAKFQQIKGSQLNPFTGVREQTKVGQWVKFKVVKNKVTGELGYEPKIPFLDNLGVDATFDILTMALNLKVVKQSGASVTIPSSLTKLESDKSCRGILAARNWLNENNDVLTVFKTEVEQKLRNNFADLVATRRANKVEILED